MNYGEKKRWYFFVKMFPRPLVTITRLRSEPFNLIINWVTQPFPEIFNCSLWSSFFCILSGFCFVFFADFYPDQAAISWRFLFELYARQLCLLCVSTVGNNNVITTGWMHIIFLSTSPLFLTWGMRKLLELFEEEEEAIFLREYAAGKAHNTIQKHV